MPIHIGTDVLVRLVLAVSPWLFDFADQIWLPHLVLGLIQIVIALVTQRHSAGGSQTDLGHAANH